jgi:hypothetical protein
MPEGRERLLAISKMVQHGMVTPAAKALAEIAMMRDGIFERVRRAKRLYAFDSGLGYQKVVLKERGKPRRTVARFKIGLQLSQQMMQELAICSLVKKKMLTEDEAGAHLLALQLGGEQVGLPTERTR